MAQLQTQLLQDQGGAWLDTTNVFLKKVNIFEYSPPTVGWAFREFPGYSGSGATVDLLLQVNNGILTIPNPVAGNDSFDTTTGIYTFADGQPNRFQTATINDNPTPTPTPSTDIDTGMGANYYEEDLTTNVKKYFAESFKFDGSQFEMDDDRIVGLKQSFIDTLATDLTNIVNTSITTATLTADVATINQTLTALGINTDLLKTKDLRLVDAQGHEHKIHLGN